MDGSLKGKVQTYQYAIRHLSGKLSPIEFAVLLRIVDMTAGWGTPSCTVQDELFLQGNDEEYGSFCEISVRSLIRARKRLCDIGLITYAKTKQGGEYTLTLPENDMARTLKTPKKPKEVSRRYDATSCKSEVTQSHNPTEKGGIMPQSHNGYATVSQSSCHSVTIQPPYIRNSRRTVQNSIGASAQTTGQQNLFPSGGKKRILEQIDQKKRLTSRTKSGKVSASDVEAAWRDAWTDSFKSSPPGAWSVKERGQIGFALKRWTSTRTPDSYLDFVTFVVSNWAAIMASEFGWMQSPPPPDHPALGFLCSIKLSRRLEGAWMEHREAEILRAASPDDKRYAALRKEGKSHDEAVLEVATEKALMRDRKQREKEKASISVARKRLAEEQRELDERAARLVAAAKKLEEHTGTKVARPSDELENVMDTLPEWDDE